MLPCGDGTGLNFSCAVIIEIQKATIIESSKAE